MVVEVIHIIWEPKHSIYEKVRKIPNGIYSFSIHEYEDRARKWNRDAAIKDAKLYDVPFIEINRVHGLEVLEARKRITALELPMLLGLK